MRGSGIVLALGTHPDAIKAIAEERGMPSVELFLNCAPMAMKRKENILSFKFVIYAHESSVRRQHRSHQVLGEPKRRLAPAGGRFPVDHPRPTDRGNSGRERDVFSVRSCRAGRIGAKKLTDKEIDRLQRHFEISKQCLDLSEGISLEIRSQIPPSIGFASSAAIFSSLAELYSGLSIVPYFHSKRASSHGLDRARQHEVSLAVLWL